MDLVQVVLFATLVIGILLVVASLIMFSREKKASAIDYLEQENTVKVIESSISEMDRTMEEFEKFSHATLEELNEKHQELLFLYTLLDEKKTEIANLYSGDAGKSTRKVPLKTDIKVDDHFQAKNVSRYTNPRSKDILNLKNQGFSVSDIAKQLNMGQGEVKLILDLSK